MAGFTQDLIYGHQAELIFFNILQEKNQQPVRAPDGYFRDWDIYTPFCTYELKWDKAAHKTSNLYFELKALRHSKAHIWVQAYGDPIQVFYLLNRKQLLAFMEKWPVTKFGGDFKDEGRIIKRQLFLQLLKPKVIEI